MDKLLSIIVPVYNVNKYIVKCVDSILAQTYKNFEVILVDDGSTDDSGKICDSYLTKDVRVKVLHKKNGGLSSARNAGLDISRGDYIGFVDSDDWIESNMYKDMIEYMDDNSCNIVECAINIVIDTSIKRISDKRREIISGKEALCRHMDQTGRYSIPRPAVWSKLFKKDFWTTNRFPDGRIHEDYLLTCIALYESEKVGIIYQGLYNHLVTNPNSIVNSKFSSRDLYRGKQYEYRTEFLLSKGETGLAEMARIEYLCYLTTAIWKCDQNNLLERNEYIKKVLTCKKEIRELHFPRHKKMELNMIILCPSMYLFFRRIVALIRKMK